MHIYIRGVGRCRFGERSGRCEAYFGIQEGEGYWIRMGR